MINVTVHDVWNDDNNRKKIFLMNSEQYKKEKLNAIRKKRIQDVRQKSKEFAHKLRENVRKETVNQMQRIERTKADELKNWRQQKLRQAHLNQHATLWDIGDAHKAAEAENLEQIEWEAQKLIAATRYGFRNKPKLKTSRPNTPKKLVKISTCNIQQSVKKLKTLGNKGNLEINDNISKSHVYPDVLIVETGEASVINDNSTNILTNNNKLVKNRANGHENHINESLISSNSSKNYNLEKRCSAPSSYADFKELQKNGLLKQNFQKTPSIVMEVGSSDTSASSLNIEDNHVDDNKLFCRVYSKDSPKKSLYNPEEFQQNSFANRTRNGFSSQTRFTQITKLINQHREQNSDKKYPEIEKNVKKITDINSKLQKIISSPKKPCNKYPENILQSNQVFVNQENDTSLDTNDFCKTDQSIISLQKTQVKKLSISPQKDNVKSPVSNIQKQIIDNKMKKQSFVNQTSINKCIPQELPNFCSAMKKPTIKTTSTILGHQENNTSRETNPFCKKDQSVILQKTQAKKLSKSPHQDNVKSLDSNIQKQIIDNKKKKQLLVNHQKPINKCVSQELPNFCSVMKKQSTNTTSKPQLKMANAQKKIPIKKTTIITDNKTNVQPTQKPLNSYNSNITQFASQSIGPSTKSVDCQTSRVKFYDYNNKFSKEYDPGLKARITSEDKTLNNLNAMQNANIERQLEAEKLKEIERLRQKSDERCKNALEREKIRRDYESLQAKLDALTVVEQPKQNINDEYLFSETRLKRQTEDRELKINLAVEDVLHKPVIITCPEIGVGRPNVVELNGINLADNMHEDLNNSDSCCSVLLHYVDNQSKQIKADIDKCGNNYEKEQKLKTLLTRINILKSTLIDELKKISKVQQIDSINEMIDSLSHLRKERENIMIISSEKKDLEKREKNLQKKEHILEKKIRQFYELKKKEKMPKNNRDQLISSNHDDSTEANSSTESVTIQKKSGKTNPIEILITVKNPKPYQKSIQNNKILDSGQKILKPKEYSKPPFQQEENDWHDQKSDGSSTQYQDMPNTMCNTLEDLVIEKCPIEVLNQQHGKIKVKPSSKNNCNLQQKKNILMSKHQPTTHNLTDQKESTSKAQLSTYIQRLLGMSRQSIHMLGASTSSVETPSLSIINSPENIGEFKDDEKERLERLQSFINENYSFLSELEESLKNDKGKSLYNDVKSEIWKKTLKKSNNIDEKRTLVLKPILKKPSPPTKGRKSANATTAKSKKDGIKVKSTLDHSQQNSKVNQKSADINAILKISSDEEKHEHFFKNYIDPDEDQVQRINELNDMIKRVRSEKQRLIEANLSPPVDLNEVAVCSDPTTDYLDLPQKNITGSNSDSTKISECHLVDDREKGTDDKQYKSQDNIDQIIDEEQVNLEKNKLTGMSRDSGISLSRPVTALDNCDSPIADTRRDKPIENFEPFLKNLPKPGKIVIEERTTLSITSKDDHIDNKIGLTSKKQKPPTTITRYSPAEIAHELSTILEIDTPATFQNNSSEQIEDLPNPNKIVTMDPILENENPLLETSTVNYNNLANFPEYSQEEKLDQFNNISNTDLTVYHHDSFHRCTQPVKTPLNISQKTFQSDGDHLSKSNSMESSDSIARIELSAKKFPTAKEYFEKKAKEDNLIDLAERLLASSSDSSVESLIDINTELKRRNMHLLPTDVYCVSEKNDKKNTVKNTLKQQDMNELSGIDILQSTKSKSSDLEKDLDNMGMNWASRMLKKTKQSQALSSSSISTLSREHDTQKTIRKLCKKETNENSEAFDDSDDSSGNSYNKLRKSVNKNFFLANELKKHSLSSNSFSDNSLVSLFIKSLIVSPKSQKSALSSGQMNKEKQHRTSTPKTSDTSMFSSNTKKSSLGTNSIKLFSGESRFSSVRLSDSSSDFNIKN